MFYYIGQTPPEACSGDREKRNDQEHHEKTSFFFHLAEFKWGFSCFVFEEISSSIPMLLVTLLAYRRKRSNSRSQMFFKTGVLKNFAILTSSLRPVHYTFPKFYLMVDN